MQEDYQAKVGARLNALVVRVSRPNILLVGKTGVGKSTLANQVFRKDVFTARTGRPVTKDIGFHDSPDTGVGIYDSRGAETGREAAFFEEVVAFSRKVNGLNGAASVHLAWHCVAAPSERLLDFDLKTVVSLRQIGVPARTPADSPVATRICSDT